MITTQKHTISIVIPVYNEEDSILPMVEEVTLAMENSPYPWELIMVNDGSSDHTLEHILIARESYGNHIRYVSLQRNFGQTAAMQAGIDATRGTIIATLDGDLQNDPADIPRMVRRLTDEDMDLVAGWRKDRQDGLWLRKVPSWIANRLIRRITGVEIHDYGCTLKIFRARILREIRLYGEMHRFIPAWLATQTSPRRICEEVVNHRSRPYGESKYGISRIYRVLLDLLSVYYFLQYRSRPGHFFGRIGLLFGTLGGVGLGYLGFIKLFLGESIGTRPLLLISILLIIMSVQFLTTGVMSEVLVRTYHESRGKPAYLIHLSSETEESENDISSIWKIPRALTESSIES